MGAKLASDKKIIVPTKKMAYKITYVLSEKGTWKAKKTWIEEQK
jgi:hypothetical protein